MKFSILGYEVSITRYDGFDAYTPLTWSAWHQKMALRKAKMAHNYIERIKAVRKYGEQTFGEFPGLRESKTFVDAYGGKGELHFH